MFSSSDCLGWLWHPRLGPRVTLRLTLRPSSSFSGSLWPTLAHLLTLWPSLAHYCSLISRLQSLIGSQGPCSALSAAATLTQMSLLTTTLGGFAFGSSFPSRVQKLIHPLLTCTGLTLATMPLLPARWRHSNRTASIYECDSSGCPGGDWNGTSDGYCAPGREGPRCEWCSDPSRYYDALTTTCEECGDMAGYALRQMAILLAIAVALGLVRAVVLRAPRLLARTSRKLAQTAMSMQQFGLQAKFKCCLSFYQVWAVRQSVYGFELPGSLSGVMAFFDALSFDFSSPSAPTSHKNLVYLSHFRSLKNVHEFYVDGAARHVPQAEWRFNHYNANPSQLQWMFRKHLIKAPTLDDVDAGMRRYAGVVAGIRQPAPLAVAKNPMPIARHSLR